MTKHRILLTNARKNKNDEFYTPYDVVENEMSQISSFFEDKFVYNNCDDGARSNFYKWFKDNFNTLKLKKLVATGYDENGIGHKYEYDGANEIITDNIGDFAKNDDLLKECDVVCTNPPFSLYSQFSRLLIENNKKFVVVGSCLKLHQFKNLLISNKLNFGHIYKSDFILSTKDGSKGQRCVWFSNVMSEKKPKMKKFSAKYADIPHIFFKGTYDNEKVLFIKKSKDIPIDYYNYIAIPLSFIGYDMSDFDFYAVMTTGSSTISKLYPLEDGTYPFARVIVKRK